MIKKTIKRIGLTLIISCLSLPLFSADYQLEFWQFWKIQWLQPALDEFERQNPPWKVKVERLTWSGGRRKLITAMAAREAPDVMEIGSTWSPEFMASGGLLALATADKNFNLHNIKSGTYQQKIYALPWTISVAGLYYNKDLLEKAGYHSPPKTWAQLLEQSRKINDPTKRVYGFGVKLGRETTWQRFLPFAWSNGGKVLDSDGKVKVNEPEFIAALDFYNNLRRAGLMDDNLTIRKAFRQNRLGFVIEDPGQMAYFTKNFPDLNFGVSALPAAPATGNHQVFGGAELLVVSKDTKHPEMAKKFISFLVDLKNTKLITDKVTTLFPAAKAGIKDDFYQKKNPQLKVFLNELAYARSTLVHPLWLDMQKSLVLHVEKMLYDRLTPQEAARELETQLNVILQE